MVSLWWTTEADAATETGKKVFLFDQPTVRVNAAIIGAKAEKLDKSLPFDGFSLFLPDSHDVFKSDAFDDTTKEAIRSTLSAFVVPNTNNQLKFSKLVNNWVLINIENPGSMYDDAAWSRVANNWKVYAEGIKDTMVGILFDNEEYQSKWSQSYPVNPLYSDPAQFYAYTNKTFERGTQVMTAGIYLLLDVTTC